MSPIIHKVKLFDVPEQQNTGETPVPHVERRPKPATRRRLKTSHFERMQVRSIASAASMSLVEAKHGESAQNGCNRFSLYTAGAGLFPTIHCPNAEDRSGNGASVCRAGVKTSRGASRLSRHIFTR